MGFFFFFHLYGLFFVFVNVLRDLGSGFIGVAVYRQVLFSLSLPPFCFGSHLDLILILWAVFFSLSLLPVT